MPPTFWIDEVFSADYRAASPDLQALARWLTVEQLMKLVRED